MSAERSHHLTAPGGAALEQLRLQAQVMLQPSEHIAIDLDDASSPAHTKLGHSSAQRYRVEDSRGAGFELKAGALTSAIHAQVSAYRPLLVSCWQYTLKKEPWGPPIVIIFMITRTLAAYWHAALCIRWCLRRTSQQAGAFVDWFDTDCGVNRNRANRNGEEVHPRAASKLVPYLHARLQAGQVETQLSLLGKP